MADRRLKKTAVDYAHLIGKYIRADLQGEDPIDSYGGAGTLVSVWDAEQLFVELDEPETIPVVQFCFDYGMGFHIRPADEDKWRFFIGTEIEDTGEYWDEKSLNQMWGNN